ncbi:MAG: hypothetical protein H0X31_04260 [Nostocaceae cyanobacterium]|nr:hypothetical protein [Nostocaceae cyanobacterium]
MNRLTSYLAASAFIFLALTACSTPNTPTASTEPAKTEKESLSKPVPASTDIKQSLVKLQGYVAGATNAAKTGDLTSSKQEFKEFKEGWEPLEQTLKTNAKDTYKTMEKQVEGLSENLLESDKPDQGKVVAKLEFLGETLNTYVKSLP